MDFAAVAALNPNLTTHTLKIGIADALDDNLDSALFIYHFEEHPRCKALCRGGRVSLAHPAIVYSC